MNKKSLTLSEQDIRTNFITPNLQKAGWKGGRMREEVYFTDGRMIVRGQIAMRGKRKWADYILYHQPNLPLAIVEAKDNRLWLTPKSWIFPLSTALTATPF